MPLIHEDLIEICLKVLSNQSFTVEFNSIDVVLIPQVKDPNSFKDLRLISLYSVVYKEPNSYKDLRPISLCSIVYKVCAKVLANRIKSVLLNFILKYQSTFVSIRQIFDNVLTVLEILHSIDKKRKGRTGQMALELDMSKTYDRVEWRFMEAILNKMNFPPI